MNKLSDTSQLTKLGSENTTYTYEGADPTLLERFPSPLKGPGIGEVSIEAPEFTSLCPMTGQPDFATIVVEYLPKDWCVESKAWKLYLGSYRQVGEFHESCIRRITNDLVRLLDPYSMVVRGEFTPRGGIPFWPTIHYEKPELTVELEDLAIDAPIPTHLVLDGMAGADEALITIQGSIVGYVFVENGESHFTDFRRHTDLGNAQDINALN